MFLLIKVLILKNYFIECRFSFFVKRLGKINITKRQQFLKVFNFAELKLGKSQNFIFF